MNLVWQKEFLEGLQQKMDQAFVPVNHFPLPTNAENVSGHDATGPDPGLEADQDAATMRLLDQMMAGTAPEEPLDDDDEEEMVDTEADIQDVDAGAPGFADYIHPADKLGELNYQQTPDVPGQDALNNQYVRVVHTNGIHHLAPVCCTCRGVDLTQDLIYGRMVPTSFVQVRTLFMTGVLDHFRACNLELKSLAYHFFSLLRRLTNPINPFKVINLYHELC